MRDFIKLCLIVGMMIFIPQVYAENHKVLVIPDNIVTEAVDLDSYIYNGTSEFFADEIINILNFTENISSPTVSEMRKLYKSNPSIMKTAKNVTDKYKTSYNIDYVSLKKLAEKYNVRYVALLTSYIDSENYILRRTFWDFLNIPGATVIDPAYKISTYVVLIDIKNNKKLWSDTYYKTISVCENRIITRGPSPQAEQLQKIKDYSRLVCPQIAQKIQINVLSPDEYSHEANKIDYDLTNLDNVFTKKYRQWRNSTVTKYNKTKKNMELRRQERNEKKLQKQLEEDAHTQLEVKATPVMKSNAEDIKDKVNNISVKNVQKQDSVKDAVYKMNTIDNSGSFNIKKIRNKSLTMVYYTPNKNN